MKQFVKSSTTIMFVVTAMLALGSCTKDMPSEAATANAINGTWAYQSTDGQDLSGYGITYSFQGTTWIYKLGDAGSKQYDFASTGNTFTATLRQNEVNSAEQSGSQIIGQYRVSGDTLEMTSNGHTAQLIRE